MIGLETEIHRSDLPVSAQHQAGTGQHHKRKRELGKQQCDAVATAAMIGRETRPVLTEIPCYSAPGN